MANLKLIIPGKPEYVTMIRLATASLASVNGFDVDQIEDIKVAVAEACKLVSCHGCEGFSDKYEVDFNVDKGCFDVTVIDACDHHSIEKTHTCTHCPEDGNIGAIMIRSLMNCVETGVDDCGHKYITMVKRAK